MKKLLKLNVLLHSQSGKVCKLSHFFVNKKVVYYSYIITKHYAKICSQTLDKMAEIYYTK